eukprot:1194937-Prorocentrum_minimum.AAC.7
MISADPRGNLLSLIKAGADEDAVLEAIEALVALDPAGGKAGLSGALGGEWELLWCSADAEVRHSLQYTFNIP